MSTDKLSAEFRAWLLEVDLLRDRQGLVPLTGREANLMEQAWQASRAALVIELPTVTRPQHAGAEWIRQDAKDEYRGAAIKAIEAAGVRVK